PGLVQTNFSRVRFRGDEEAARKVYEGVKAMTPEDVADCILFAVTRPPHVNVDEIVVKALAQSSGGRILRKERAPSFASWRARPSASAISSATWTPTSRGCSPKTRASFRTSS